MNARRYLFIYENLFFGSVNLWVIIYFKCLITLVLLESSHNASDELTKVFQ